MAVASKRVAKLACGVATASLLGGAGCGFPAFGVDLDAGAVGDGGAAGDDATTSTNSGDATLADSGPGKNDGSPTKKPDGATSLLCGTTKDPATLGPSCCTVGSAHCLPDYDVEASQFDNFSSCTLTSGGGGVCVPDKIITAGTEFNPKTCSSLGNAKGVCLSKCLGALATNPAESLLPRDTCDEDELCAPCIDPLTMKSSGACDIMPMKCGVDAGQPGEGGTTTGDGGSSEGGGGIMCPYTGPALVDPTTFPACAPACNGAHCVPAALVPAAEQSLLNTCGSGATAGYCAPDSVISSAGEGIPPSCVSVAGVEGRCLSACIPQVAAQVDVLPQSTCDAGLYCTPCYNPTAADPTAPTGACSIACDKPKDPPTILTCPYTGPAIIDPTVFPGCDPTCGGAHCVPSALVSAADQSLLATCGSGAGAGYCTPDSLSSTGGLGVPATCTSVAGAEGRCLSTCLPSVAAQADALPQATCATGELCAPCYDPAAADPTAPTGACSIACDTPKDPPTILTCPYTGPDVIDPTTFPACSPPCAGAHCIPSALVPASQQSQLATCPGGFCTPDPIAASDDHYVPPTCQPFADPASEGRCTSECLPAVAAQSSELTVGPCGTNQLCAPCYDPFSGISTGACNLACDTPKDPAFTFPRCCEYEGKPQGTCLPKDLIPSSEQTDLQSEECPTDAANPADYLCVPQEYLPNSTLPIQTCTATLGGAGVCVSKCVNVPGGFLFQQNDCTDGNHVCVACSIGGSSVPGCN